MTQRMLDLYNSIHACLEGNKNACNKCMFNGTDNDNGGCLTLMMEELSDAFEEYHARIEELEETIEALSPALAASGEVASDAAEHATVTTEPFRATTDNGVIIGMVNRIKDTLICNYQDSYTIATDTSSREESAFYLGRALAFNQAYIIVDNGLRRLNKES